MKIKVLMFSLFLFALSLHSQTRVIAHQGYWLPENAAKNSLMALKSAQDLGLYASEFDVWITADDVLVVNHDPGIDNIIIEKVNLADLKDVRLSNGEPLPTLEQYIIQAKENSKVKLLLELKPHKSREREDAAIKKIVELVKKYGVENQMEYIAFDLNTCKEFKRLHPQVPTAYLKGELSPQEIKEIGLDGIDYNYKIFDENENWVEEAQKLGLKVNVWTVDEEDKMQKMIDLGVDFITTNKPIDCQKLIDKSK